MGQPSSALLCWSQGSPSGFGSTGWDLTRAQRQTQHHGSAPQPWLPVKPQNAPVKPPANTDTGAASCTVLLLLTMGGVQVNHCSYPFTPMSCAGLPDSAHSLQCCFSFRQLFWFECILCLWMDGQPRLVPCIKLSPVLWQHCSPMENFCWTSVKMLWFQRFFPCLKFSGFATSHCS